VDGKKMFEVGCGSLGCFLQEVPLSTGRLFFVCVLFYKILQEFLEESGYLAEDGLELFCGDDDDVVLYKVVEDLLD
jgi:hypothetical protein